MRLAEQVVALPYRRFCGKTIRGYRVGRMVGIGGSGVVFEAADPEGQPVALKLLRPMRATYNLDEVWREVAPLSRIDHPAAPSWLGIVRKGRAYFIVMTRLPGVSLAGWLFERRHAFDAHEIVRVGAAMADALAHFHERGVAHGDVRPANVLYDGESISFADFGMSVCAEQDVPAFREACRADVAGFADVLIYLLYSSCEAAPRRCGKPAAADWRDELPLSQEQRRFLEEAFSLDVPTNMQVVRDCFLTAFSTK